MGEKERICSFCGRSFNRGSMGMQEYKFCPNCYHERLAHVDANTSENSDVSLIDLGNGYTEVKFERKEGKKNVES